MYFFTHILGTEQSEFVLFLYLFVQVGPGV